MRVLMGLATIVSVGTRSAIHIDPSVTKIDSKFSSYGHKATFPAVLNGLQADRKGWLIHDR